MCFQSRVQRPKWIKCYLLILDLYLYFFQSRPTDVKRVLLKLGSKIVVIMSTFVFFSSLDISINLWNLQAKSNLVSSRLYLKLFSMLKLEVSALWDTDKPLNVVICKEYFKMSNIKFLFHILSSEKNQILGKFLLQWRWCINTNGNLYHHLKWVCMKW